MERWINKVAVVTGSNSGIGAAIAVDLAKCGMTVIGLDICVDRVEELKKKIPKQLNGKVYGKLHVVKCDVSQENDVKSAFDWIKKEFGGVDVLVNNAAVTRLANLIDPDNTNVIREIVDTNIMGVVFCTREAFQSMKSRNVAGHVVLINSITGHRILYVVDTMPSFNIYPATKYALTAMNEVFRQEFQSQGTKVKVTSISPGITETEIFTPEHWEVMKKQPHLKSEDVSEAVLYVLGTPSHVQVHELIIKPVGEKF